MKADESIIASPPPPVAPQRQRVCLFGIDIDPLTMTEAVAQILRWVSEKDAPCRYVVTPNVNHVVRFQHDAQFREAYSKASLVLADGRYLYLSSLLFGERIPETVNGSDLVPALFDASREFGSIRVFLLGAAPSVGAEAAKQVRRRWPWVEIVGHFSPPWGFEKFSSTCEEMAARVTLVSPDVVIVGISPPKQELWAANYGARLDASVVLCVGATIDFVAGYKVRAPLWMQKAGLEWMHRVVNEPRRLLSRYFKDGVIFIWLLLREFVLRWFRSA